MSVFECECERSVQVQSEEMCFKGRLRVCLYESERSVICGIQ